MVYAVGLGLTDRGCPSNIPPCLPLRVNEGPLSIDVFFSYAPGPGIELALIYDTSLCARENEREGTNSGFSGM